MQQKNERGNTVSVIKHKTDYEWQKLCLESRLRHPEAYETEDVNKTIKRLRKQIKEYEKENEMNELKLFKNEEFEVA